MARPKGIKELVPRRPRGEEFNDPAQLTDDVLKRCIEIYLNTGNYSAVGRAVGRGRGWAMSLFKSPRAIEMMRSESLQLRGNTNIASIEECMAKLTSIARGDQLAELADRVKAVADNGGDSVAVADAIDKITRFTPQIESNQIKATTMLLQAQGALDPNKAANEDHQSVLDQVILELVKSEGSVEAILEGIKKQSRINVIDVTPENE